MGFSRRSSGMGVSMSATWQVGVQDVKILDLLKKSIAQDRCEDSLRYYN